MIILNKEFDISKPPGSQSSIIERLLWLISYCKEEQVRGIRYNKDIIERAELGNSYISDLKSGSVVHPSAEAIGSIADVTGANINWIIFGEGNPLLESDIGSTDDYQTQQAKELHHRIIRYLNNQKKQATGDSPPRNLLLAFRDQLESQIAHSRNQANQLEAMHRFLGVLLGDDSGE